MTDLPTLLHERADRAALRPVDLDAVIRDGARRVRRRRVASGAAALAVVGSLGATAALDGGAPDRGLDPAAPAPAPAAGASWYVDGRLHHDGTSTDLGIDVAAYVRTAVGFVLVDTDDVVWSWTGGRPERVGRAEDDGQRLAADPEGEVAAWIDATESDRGLLVLDQASGLVTDYHDVGPGEAEVTAVDGDRVWWREGSRSLTWSVADGGLAQRLDDGTRVLAAAGDRVVYLARDEVRTAEGARGSYTVLDESYRDVGALSPDGALWSADADEVGVVRTTDGSAVGVRLDAAFSTGFEWLDEDSLVVLTGAGDPDDGDAMTAGLVVCKVPDGACTTVAEDLGTFAELQARGFALPVGVELG